MTWKVWMQRMRPRETLQLGRRQHGRRRVLRVDCAYTGGSGQMLVTELVRATSVASLLGGAGESGGASIR